MQRGLIQADGLGLQLVHVQDGALVALAHHQAGDVDRRRQPPGDNALPVAALPGELFDRDALGAAIRGHQEDLAGLGQQVGAAHFVAFLQLDAHHAGCHQPHRAYFILAEADCHAAGACQEQFFLAVCQKGPAHAVAGVDFCQHELIGRGAGQLTQGGFFEHALAGDSQYEPVIQQAAGIVAQGVLREREERCQFVLGLEGGHPVNGDAIGGRVAFGQGVYGQGGGLAGFAHQVERVAGVGLRQPTGRLTAAEARRFLFQGT